jgi:hypothetical protein
VSAAGLPEDGPATIAGVQLPAGERIYGWSYQISVRDGRPFPRSVRSQTPAAWVTSRPMADAGDAFLALSGAHARTGLVPVLFSPSRGADTASAGAFGVHGREDLSLLDAMSAQAVLAGYWEVDPEEFAELDMADQRAPFGPDFPGLAPAEQTRLSEDRLRSAAASEEPAFLALVVAGRPADVPAAVGWSVFGSDSPGRPDARSLQISTVLRSWETRFGARPLRIGGDSILRVLVERPPSTLETATALAAEHLAFADECDGRNGYSVSRLARILVGKPVWQFWWD